MRDVHLHPQFSVKKKSRTLEMALTSKCRPTRTNAKAKTPHQSNASMEKALEKKAVKDATAKILRRWCWMMLVGNLMV